jgi:peptide-methionine (S)-S-oxide reductase
MKNTSYALTVTLSGLSALALAFVTGPAGAERKPASDGPAQVRTAVFAGGCFWCVESDFDKLPGVIDTTSGYTGGTVLNPTYKQVSREDTGHFEAVRVTYDPALVSYAQLTDYFLRHIDPLDTEGQFCDKGESYKTAIFVARDSERKTAEAELAEAAQLLKQPVAVKVREASTFWPAEDYHQDYYKKNPVRYKYYRTACGRDGRVKEVWGEKGKS